MSRARPLLEIWILSIIIFILENQLIEWGPLLKKDYRTNLFVFCLFVDGCPLEVDGMGLSAPPPSPANPEAARALCVAPASSLPIWDVDSTLLLSYEDNFNFCTTFSRIFLATLQPKERQRSTIKQHRMSTIRERP